MDVSEQSSELTDSAIKRLKDDGIEYRLDDEGNVLIRESGLNKAVTCCS
ncbi:hypothetical protein [Bacillus salacetis]|nr:hypothetical protein [Bacillus salacetis]